METQHANVRGGRQRQAGLFALFLLCSLAVFVFGANYFTIFPTNKNLGYSVILSAVMLAAAIWLRRTERFVPYWQSAFAFFTGSFAILITLLAGSFSDTLLGWFNVTISSSQGKAVDKLYEAAMIVVPIIVLTKLAGGDLGSIYIKRGNLKWGIGSGALVLLNFASSAFLFFGTRYADAGRLGAAVVWGAVFAFANGFMEEVWLRGIFLRRFQPLLGMGGAVLLTSVVFALMHSGADYLPPAAIPFMVANTFTLGIACGYLMMKTDSIWGATLIHAAADFFLFIATLADA